MPEDTIPTEKLPANAVIRVSRGNFDSSQFTKVDTLAQKQAEYLVPAIKQLPGLIHWYTGVSPEGSMTQVSVWDTEAHAAQMDHLKEMAVIARGEMQELGLNFIQIVNYPIVWVI
jgi:hypothetical protein